MLFFCAMSIECCYLGYSHQKERWSVADAYGNDDDAKRFEEYRFGGSGRENEGKLRDQMQSFEQKV